MTAQQLTELGDLNGTNEACLPGMGQRWSIAATFPARIRAKSVKVALKATATNFLQTEEGGFDLVMTTQNQHLRLPEDDLFSHPIRCPGSFPKTPAPTELTQPIIELRAWRMARG